MTWGEALRLVRILTLDPSSQAAAAVAEWDHPISREAVILADLYDLQHQSKSKKKVTPYPRPFGSRRRKKVKPSPSLSQDQIIAALRSAGHTAPLPTSETR